MSIIGTSLLTIRTFLPYVVHIHDLVNIVDIGSVIISSSHHDAAGFLGDTLILECSVDIKIRFDSPQPTFQWFFGSANASLPSGVTVSAVRCNGSTYINILNISHLQESHSGMYICQLSGNTRLAANATVNVLSNQTISKYFIK